MQRVTGLENFSLGTASSRRFIALRFICKTDPSLPPAATKGGEHECPRESQPSEERCLIRLRCTRLAFSPSLERTSVGHSRPRIIREQRTFFTALLTT
jgi:hypothetical protein